MLFGSTKREKPANGAPRVSDPGVSEATARQSRQWLAWRRSAQRATRTWNEWLAADRRQRDNIYRCYVAALAEEERAAAELSRLSDALDARRIARCERRQSR